MLAHHGIVFQPADLKVWISANPYQLGAFVCYDLEEVFTNRAGNPSLISLSEKEYTIAASPFLQTQAYENYEAYRKIEAEIETEIKTDKYHNTSKVEGLMALNPEYWKAHYLAGRYYYEIKNYKEAVIALTEASQKEIPSLDEVELVEKFLKKAKRKLK